MKFNSQQYIWIFLILLNCRHEAFAQVAEHGSARLEGIAQINSDSRLRVPKDAPKHMRVSGRFVGDFSRKRDLGAYAGRSFLSDPKAPRWTNVSLPMHGQPLQGFSGIKSLGEDRFLVISDNGFGSKIDSADALLSFHRIEIDWKRNSVKVLPTHFLRDPNHVLPFPIVNNDGPRYLTGADLDPESIQPVGDGYFIGDEFGPYLIRVDQKGTVTHFFETVLDGRVLRSPDHYLVRTPNVPGAVDFSVQRSRGFEGMAQSEDGLYLYPMLEGAIWDDTSQGFEQKDGKRFFRILEFDIRAMKFTSNSFQYFPESDDYAIGDFNIVSTQFALVIERDNGEGDVALKCSAAPTSDCFNKPAQFKRIYKVDWRSRQPGQPLKKVGNIDLLAISDLDQKSRNSRAGQFSFPYVTIENVDAIDDRHIIVANDNNFGASAGRQLGQNDPTEFLLLEWDWAK